MTSQQAEEKRQGEVFEMLLKELKSLVYQINNFDVVDRLEQHIEPGTGADFRQFVLSAKAAIHISETWLANKPQSHQGWVEVEKGLPDLREDVLTLVNDAGNIFMCVNEIEGKMSELYGWKYYMYSVTHWMYLPDKPIKA